MNQPDFYEVLQVSPNADAEVIQAAYKRLALKYHPDRNHDRDADVMMRLLNEAYDTLSDAYKRGAYDANRVRAAAHWQSANAPPNARQSVASSSAMDAAGIVKLVKALFPPVKPSFQTLVYSCGAWAIIIPVATRSWILPDSIGLAYFLVSCAVFVTVGAVVAIFQAHMTAHATTNDPNAAWYLFAGLWLTLCVVPPLGYWSYLRIQHRDGDGLAAQVQKLRAEAVDHYQKRDYEKARLACTEAISIFETKLKPSELKDRGASYASLYSLRGGCHMALKDYDRAISDCTKAIELDSTRSRSYETRGFAYLGKKDYPSAVSDFSNAIRLGTSDGTAHLGRAGCYHEMGKQAESEADAREAKLRGGLFQNAVP